MIVEYLKHVQMLFEVENLGVQRKSLEPHERIAEILRTPKVRGTISDDLCLISYRED